NIHIVCTNELTYIELDDLQQNYLSSLKLESYKTTLYVINHCITDVIERRDEVRANLLCTCEDPVYTKMVSVDIKFNFCLPQIIYRLLSGGGEKKLLPAINNAEFRSTNVSPS
ncbi:hypothetical protein L9F63_009214, partial [Diploptera punctata]